VAWTWRTAPSFCRLQPRLQAVHICAAPRIPSRLPTSAASWRPARLVFYSPEDIEALARALADGLHRDLSRPAVSTQEHDAQEAEDRQDAEMVRVAAYAGLWQGELLALRWSDVDFSGSALTIVRSMSAGVEFSTKSGRVRRVPLADQAAAALDRMSRRTHFTSPDDLVFFNALGRSLDDSALRRRYRHAQAAADVRPLRFHDPRHTFGSPLAMLGVDVVTIQKAMEHSALTTTSRYLHARPPSEQAQAFTAAFMPEGSGRRGGVGLICDHSHSLIVPGGKPGGAVRRRSDLGAKRELWVARGQRDHTVRRLKMPGVPFVLILPRSTARHLRDYTWRYTANWSNWP